MPSLGLSPRWLEGGDLKTVIPGGVNIERGKGEKNSYWKWICKWKSQTIWRILTLRKTAKNRIHWKEAKSLDKYFKNLLECIHNLERKKENSGRKLIEGRKEPREFEHWKWLLLWEHLLNWMNLSISFSSLVPWRRKIKLMSNRRLSYKAETKGLLSVRVN